MEHIQPHETASDLIAAIKDYDRAQAVLKKIDAILYAKLTFFIESHHDPARGYAWLRSQPLAALGILIPQEILDQLPIPQITCTRAKPQQT